VRGETTRWRCGYAWAISGASCVQQKRSQSQAQEKTHMYCIKLQHTARSTMAATSIQRPDGHSNEDVLAVCRKGGALTALPRDKSCLATIATRNAAEYVMTQPQELYGSVAMANPALEACTGSLHRSHTRLCDVPILPLTAELRPTMQKTAARVRVAARYAFLSHRDGRPELRRRYRVA
jgi:hypothetical protein